jgi:pimeloyl-ACP methyl ester carboxylesterase
MIGTWHRMIIASGLGIPSIDQSDHQIERECVVLLHGLARTPNSMKVLQWSLENNGYRVINQGYPSRRGGIDSLADAALGQAIEKCGSAPKIHVVCHSLGGILLRHWSARNKIRNAGRAVMLGPPNAGSELVDAFHDWDLFTHIHGPAGRQLGTRCGSSPSGLPECAHFELGIIAGNKSLNLLSTALIKGPNDGKVSVSSAFAIPAKDKLVLPVSHTWMTMDKGVVAAVERFLERGSF